MTPIKELILEYIKLHRGLVLKVLFNILSKLSVVVCLLSSVNILYRSRERITLHLCNTLVAVRMRISYALVN